MTSGREANPRRGIELRTALDLTSRGITGRIKGEQRTLAVVVAGAAFRFLVLAVIGRQLVVPVSVERAAHAAHSPVGLTRDALLAAPQI